MQEILELLSESIGTLTLNKLRTGLAILGIVIGIGSVIALVSLGQASQQAIQTQIQSLGANLLTITPGSQNTGAVRGAAGGAQTLTNDDAASIMSSPQVTDVAQVAPQYSSRGQAIAGANNTNTSIIGVTNTYAGVTNTTVSDGAFISSQDNMSMAKVAVIGPTVAQTLFPDGSDPVGQNIRITGIPFTVIGVTVSKGGTGFANRDDTIYIATNRTKRSLWC